MNWSQPTEVALAMVAAILIAYLMLETTFAALDRIDRDIRAE